MKRIVQFSWLVFIVWNLISCGKIKGDINIQGVMIEECGGVEPVKNAKISIVDKGLDEILSTTTDENGDFHLKGRYELPRRRYYESLREYFLICETTDNNRYYLMDFYDRLPKDLNTIDFIYLYNATYSVLTINLDNQGMAYGNSQDTLFVNYVNFPDHIGVPSYEVPNTEKVYVGPFFDGQILDTIHTRIPSHVGYDKIGMGEESSNWGCSFYFKSTDKWGRGRYPFFDGQTNLCGGFTNVYIDLN